MSEPSSLLDELCEEAIWRLEEVCCRFEQSWQTGQRPRLEDFLGDAAGVERLAVLRELLRLDVHYRRRAGEGPDAQDYAPRFPDAVDLLSQMFPGCPENGPVSAEPGADSTTDDIQRTGPYLGARDPAGREASAAEGPASRFQRRRFHAAGGLGEVFVAEDQELHREVALKEIKQKYADMNESRERFVLEAEITGKLEHPGVVPVYGLGTYPDGRPFYAMRFIRGDTLATAIKQFHSQTPVRFDSLSFRQLLGRLVAVCQAVAYAHSRGVLHRDIKPGNIMLGKFGETLVVDWGLAKVIDRPDAAAPGSGEEGLLRPSGRGVQATVGVVGTPAYMSPEQAAGKVEELNPATDVYSLGATLYELLTNRAPFKGPMIEVIKQVERGEWQPPRQVNGAVPGALDAICRKAMALRPEERYGSALALAEDVEHWLGDEPVAAYSEPAVARLRRWMRKRPRRVTAAVVMLLTAVIGLTVGTLLLEGSRRETRESLVMVEEQANYLVQGVSDDQLLIVPGIQRLRGDILVRVLRDYEDFLKKHPGNLHARQQMAGAKRQLAELYIQTGLLIEAKARAEQAVNLFEGLHRESPPDQGLRFGLARAWYVMADLQVHSGDPGEGRKAVDRSIELLERLIAEVPGKGDNPITLPGGFGPQSRRLRQEQRMGECLTTLARSYDLRATIEGQQGHIEAGLADCRRVLEILIERNYSVPDRDIPFAGKELLAPTMLHFNAGRDWLEMGWPYLLLLGGACTNQGMLLSMSGRNGESARVLEQSIAIHRRLLEQNSRASPFRHGLALALLHSGRIKIQLELPGRAEPVLREALDLLRQLIQDDPLVKEYSATRLLAAGYLGEALFRKGRTVPAVGLLQDAEMDREEALTSLRKNFGLRGQHARLLHVRGCLEWESGALDKGLGDCRKAHEILEQALREMPGNQSLHSDWLANREALARCRFLKGDLNHAGWIAEQQEILQERKVLVGQGPPLPRFQGELAGSAAILAGLLLEAGRSVEALAYIDGVLLAHENAVRTERDRVQKAAKEREEVEPVPVKARNTGSLRRFLRNMPIIPDHSLQRRWAMLLAQKGAALAQVGRGAEAGEVIQHAISITRSCLFGGDIPVVRQSVPADLAAAITQNLLLGSDPFHRSPASLAFLSADFAGSFGRLEPCYCYDLACHLTLASTLPGGSGRPDPAGEAVRLLRCYVASGFDNLHQLRTDPRLEPLRKRGDFQNLVHDLETKSPGRNDATLNR